MNEQATLMLPSADALVRRAEEVLGIDRSSTGAAVSAPDTPRGMLADLDRRLAGIERGYWALVPPGYESLGRATRVKRFFKQVIRRSVWWYVEPRWTVQRELTAELAGIVQVSIHTMRAMSDELETLRSRVGQLESHVPGQLV